MNFTNVINAAGSRITGGSDYGWQCYGTNSQILDFQNIDKKPYAHCVFDRETQTVYEIVVEVPNHTQAYRWINLDFRDAYYKESNDRGLDPNNAWDNVSFTHVDTEELILEYLEDIGNINYSNINFNQESIMSNDRFKVDLDIRFVFDVEASSMDEALEKAHEWQETMKVNWGKNPDVTWMDHEVVKETVSRELSFT
jgi:hypothetical protein